MLFVHEVKERGNVLTDARGVRVQYKGFEIENQYNGEESYHK